MSHKRLFTVSILSSLLMAAAAIGDNGTSGQNAAADRRGSQPAAPVIHRRASVPSGWFQQTKQPIVLNTTQVQGARQAAHFDTNGNSGNESTSTAKPGVSQRLLQMRRAVVYEDLPPGTPPARRIEKTRVPQPVAQPAAPSESAVAEASPTATAPPTGDGSATDATALTVDPNDVPVDPLPLLVDQLPSIMKQPEAPQSAGEAPAAPPVANDEPRMQLRTIPPAISEASDTSPAANASAAAPALEAQPIAEPVAASPIIEMIAPAETPPVASPSGPDAGMREGVLVTQQSPVLSVATRGPRTIVVGKVASYILDLSNSSEFDAKDVVVRMNIPHWVEVVQQNGTAGSTHIQPDDQGDSALTWSVGRLPARGQEKLTLELIPRGSRPLDLGVTWTFSPATSTAQIQVQEPKLEMTVTGSQDVMYGETKVYTISISNPGTGDAENVVLNLLPLVPSEGSAGVRPLGTIAAGARRTIEVELTARQTGRLQVRAEATADGGLRCEAQQEVLVRRAVLDVQVDGPPMKYAGTKSRYAIRVMNSGDATAQEVVAVVTLPAGAQGVACSDGATVDSQHGQVQWQLGSLRAGASRVVEMECVLMSPGANRIDLRTVAAGDLSAIGSTTTTVESLADLKLVVNDPKGAVAVGSEVIYEVRIVNRGTKAAENIGIIGYFSEGIEPIAVRGWRGSMQDGEVVLERIPRLGAGQEMVVRIAAQADRPGDHVFRAELECRDPETKLAVEEWTRFFGDIEVQAARPVESPAAAAVDASSSDSEN